jgi:guanylate kinase
VAGIANGPDDGDDAVSSTARVVSDAGRAYGRIFVISGPSGVGKDTIKNRLRDSKFRIGFCVTATTRPPRDGEVHGRDYLFMSEEEFRTKLDQGQFIEHAVVHGKHLYGNPLEGLRAGMRSGDDVLVTPDVKGAATLRALIPQATSIFLMPASSEELRLRIADPKSGRTEDLEARMRTAAAEMRRMGEFDYVVVNENGKLNESVDAVKAIITAERLRVKQRRVVL